VFDVVKRNDGTRGNRSLGCSHKTLLLFRKVGHDVAFQVKAPVLEIFNDLLDKIVIFHILCDHLIFEHCMKICSIRLQLDD